MAVETLDVVKALEWRYATKNFDPNKKIDAATWSQIEKSLILSPSSFGLQPWKFVVITDEKVKKELLEVSWKQNQPADCSHLVVICRVEKVDTNHIDKYIASVASSRGVLVESQSAYRNMMVNSVTTMDDETQVAWASAQCYIALGVLMTAASMLGVDNCPMEGFVKEEYDRILKLKEQGVRSVVVCALGYRSAEDKYATMPKVRYPASELVIRV